MSKAKRAKQPRNLYPDPIRRLPADHQAAARSLTNHEYCKSLKYKAQSLKTSWEGVHPDILDFHKAFQKELLQRGYPFYAFFFWRSHELQDELYRQGSTKARGGQSPHNYGCAVDEVHCYKFWDLTRKQWAVLGAIGKEVARRKGIKIVWGGDWKFYDPVHFQLADWKRYKADIDRLDIEVTTQNLTALRWYFSACDRAQREKKPLPDHPFE